jgi:HSP20 family protein
MADDQTKVPGKVEKMAPTTLQPWRPFESLRREVDRLFDDFSGGIWRSPFSRSFFDIDPFRRTEAAFGVVPAVNVTQTDKGYEITAELPGMEEKDVDVKLANGILTIRGEKRDEKEEKNKDYMCASVASAPSSARFRYQKTSTRIRSALASKKAC